MRRVLLSLVFAGAASLALAMVGGAPPASDAVARRVALIVGSRGNFCSGVALARDLVLTAAHCVTPGADYKLVEYDARHQPILRDVADIARHPQFELKALLAHRATADVALLKLAQPADSPRPGSCRHRNRLRSAIAFLSPATELRCVVTDAREDRSAPRP